MKKVVVLGASANPERYSNMLIRRLLAKDYIVYPVHPALREIEGLPVLASLNLAPPGADVLSVYLRADRSTPLLGDILATGIPRVIFNPGAENPQLEKALKEKGVEVENACSLVLAGLGEL